MYYLIFRPYRLKNKRNQNGYHYDFRNQNFVGFTDQLNDALTMALDNPDNAYQIYELSDFTLDFRMSKYVRYGVRNFDGLLVPYTRTVEGQESFLNNPRLSDEENEKLIAEATVKHLEYARVLEERRQKKRQKVAKENGESKNFVEVAKTSMNKMVSKLTGGSKNNEEEEKPSTN